MARVRVQTYEAYAWPQALGALYRRQGLFLALALAASLSLLLVLGAALHGSLWHAPIPGGDFYRVFPHNLMVALFAPVFGFAVLALGVGAARFWRGQSPGPIEMPAAAEATRSALTLPYLGGGHGEGCNDEDDAFALKRRRMHHLAFYGFMLCFAATSTGTLYHYFLGRVAPYDYTTLPKLFGIPGGILLAIGSVGLWRLNRRRDPQHGDLAQRPMDRGFIALLFLSAVTGLLLTAFRGTAALALLLSVHLGVVLALFVTLPYGKFAHGIYRSAALLKWAVEKRQPNPLGLADD
jgi:citrate/tricarballylate utilization protein